MRMVQVGAILGLNKGTDSHDESSGFLPTAKLRKLSPQQDPHRGSHELTIASTTPLHLAIANVNVGRKDIPPVSNMPRAL